MAPDRTSKHPIAHTAPGAFFEAAAALPRGAHALPRAEVLAEQRERLMAAVTELIAAGGFGGVTIGALASRAKVSRSAFYECFANKEACAFAAYDRFIAVLLGALARGAGEAGNIDELIAQMLDGYFATLERDLVATRAFLVEFDALGPPARERRRVALRSIAGYVRVTHGQFAASDPTLAAVFDEDIYLGIVYMARQLACDALDEQRTPDLRAIGRTISPWLSSAFRAGGARRATSNLLESAR